MYLLEFAGEDDALAAAEAESAAAAVERIAPALGVAKSLSLERVSTLALTHRASTLLGRTDASLESVRALLEAAQIDREGSVAVRARTVHGSDAVSTATVETALGSVLVDRGFSVDLEDPDHELRAVFAEGPVDSESVGALGWLAAESVRDFRERAPTEKPFFQPGSMDPALARAVTNVAGAGPGRTLVDPMCGTGGLLVEAGLVGATTVGTDAQRKMVDGARENLSHYLKDGTTALDIETGPWAVSLADATRLPFQDDIADGVVFDAPYGRQSRIAGHEVHDLVRGALEEAQRIAPRAVLVADRAWTDAATAAGWTIAATFERRVHRSLTRHILVLDR